MAFFYETMRENEIGEDQNKPWDEPLKRHKVPILKYLCLSLPLFILTGGRLFVLVYSSIMNFLLDPQGK